jgi:hypothetical protein
MKRADTGENDYANREFFDVFQLLRNCELSWKGTDLGGESTVDFSLVDGLADRDVSIQHAIKVAICKCC